MAFTYRVLRSSVPLSRPADHAFKTGELYVNLFDEQLGVINENNQPMDLIAIRFFRNKASYKKGDFIVYNAHLYQANKDITGPKNFDPDDWDTSGADLTIADYDQVNGYEKGETAWFPGDNCFLQAAVDIPAGTPFDESLWEGICHGGGGSGGGGLLPGDIIMSVDMLDPLTQTDRRLVLMHGQELPRNGEYESLFKRWGVKYGEGNGASTFNVPDMRGVVPRGVDESLAMDPDAASRYSRYPGPGSNTGAMGGTLQDDQVGKHRHSFRLDEPANDHTGNKHGYHRGMVYNWHPLQYTYYHDTSETRMKNIGVHWYAHY